MRQSICISRIEILLSVGHSSVVIIVMVAQSLYCGIPVVCFRSLKMNNRKAKKRIKVGVWGIEVCGRHPVKSLYLESIIACSQASGMK
jgi:hypothetical protein